MTTPAAPTGTLSVQIPNADGSINNYTASLANFAVTVTPPPPPPEPAIPATAAVVDMLPATVPWAMTFDPGTQTKAGTAAAEGTTGYPVAAPDGTLNCRVFNFKLTGLGGITCHANVMKNGSAYNTFCYETQEYFVDPSNLNCMEKDLEQADATGAYVDMATQLNGTAGCLNYTANQAWQSTAVKANPTALPKGTWITTRRYFKNLGGGMVEYIGSYDNGVYSPLNITAKSQPTKPWGANVLNVQYQFDGKSLAAVQSTVYVRVFKIHCWES
ncbi:MAG TPA: hypothetical protein VGH38_02790 [Bryobacteraceae bacterium]